MTRTPAHCLRRAYAAARDAYDRARANPDPWEGLEGMRAANDILTGIAVFEVEVATGRCPLDLAR